MDDTFRTVPLKQVRVTEPFWQSRQRLMTDTTIPYMEKILRDEIPGAVQSHAIANFRQAAGEEGGTFHGMVFQDSDVAKWLEAASYALLLRPDPALDERLDDMIALIARAQQPDGYLNTYFTVKEPENRWRNLLECHELYCAGHLLEAAAAHFEATGKRTLLDVAERLAGCIIRRFGPEGQAGIPGHQEIEIGLMRLYHVTGKAEYRDMACRFLDLRGQDPAFFQKHTPDHPGIRYGDYTIDAADTAYNQSDLPVRDQTEARGHAVRCLYMLTAMTDAAKATGDEALLRACERMFDDVTRRQMYVTGAVGATAHHEAFLGDWELPNDTGYGETCASVALAFCAHGMLLLRPEGRYADVLERVLFNAALAGMQLDGERYFYVNPLEVVPGVSGVKPGYAHVQPERPRWHACACCPPNLARLLTSLGRYLWTETGDALYSHLFIGSETETALAQVTLRTEYPLQGRAVYTVAPHTAEPFALAIHIPGYAAASFTVTLNGAPCTGENRHGYWVLCRVWKAGDTVEIAFPMQPRRVYADARVRADVARVALARGPLIYCLEGVDNGGDLGALYLPEDAALTAQVLPGDPLGACPRIIAKGLRQLPQGELYASEPPEMVEAALTAIPYFAWGNRGRTGMTVWLHRR